MLISILATGVSLNRIQLLFASAILLPTFLTVFWLQWRRSRAGANLLTITLKSAAVAVLLFILSVGALFAFFIYATRTIEDDHSADPMTVMQARNANCPISLPDSAYDVRFAQAHGRLIACEILVRFDAPPEICRSWALATTGLSGHPLTILNGATPKLRPDMIRQIDWFDIGQIVHGETADGGNTQVWIDDARGVFYCRITD